MSILFFKCKYLKKTVSNLIKNKNYVSSFYHIYQYILLSNNLTLTDEIRPEKKFNDC